MKIFKNAYTPFKALQSLLILRIKININKITTD